jgi:Membrane protein TerC, possibly involved in tellurium resistance
LPGCQKGNWVLIFIGLAVSIPLVVYGSNLLSGLMKRYPIIIAAGAAILGWTAGEMIIHDLERLVTLPFNWLPVVSALAVVAWGYLTKRREAAVNPDSE